MQITRVLLKNFAQHKFVDQYLTENIVGIVGRNGSGKSNFASAISIAISGEFGKKKKKEYITFGEKSGEIQVEGVINSKNFIIKRSVQMLLIKFGHFFSFFSFSSSSILEKIHSLVIILIYNICYKLIFID